MRKQLDFSKIFLTKAIQPNLPLRQRETGNRKHFAFLVSGVQLHSHVPSDFRHLRWPCRLARTKRDNVLLLHTHNYSLNYLNNYVKKVKIFTSWLAQYIDNRAA
jgi:hypothetical protein